MPKNSPAGGRPDFDLTQPPKKRAPARKSSRGQKANKKGGGSGPRLRLSKRVIAAYSYLGLLLVIWFVQHFMAEKHWLLAYLTYLPQHGLLAPLVLLYYSAFRQKCRPAMLVNSVSLLLIVFVFLGFNIPWSGIAGQKGPAGSHVPLRVMSYNCRLTPESYRNIAAVIKKHKPDVVCLQEAPGLGDAKLVRKLVTLFPDWYSSRNGELLTLSRHIITSARVFHIRTKDATGVLKTMIDVDGQDVAVFNVHLNVPASRFKIKSIMQESMPKRAAQLGLLVSEAEDSAMPTVIAGDFNTPPRGLIYRTMKERWTDSFRRTGWGFGNTYPEGSPLIRIDYIWSSDQLEVRDCSVAGDAASDHYPLLANFRLKRAK